MKVELGEFRIQQLFLVRDREAKLTVAAAREQTLFPVNFRKCRIEKKISEIDRIYAAYMNFIVTTFFLLVKLHSIN